MDIPAQPPGEALEDQLVRLLALLVHHAALAGVLGDAGHARCDGQRQFGGPAQRAEAHRRDHHRHRQVQRLGAVLVAQRRTHLDPFQDVRIAAGLRQVPFEGDVGQMRQRPRGAITADAVTAHLRLDIDILLNLLVPVIGRAGEGEERDVAAWRLRVLVAQLGAGIDDLLEGSGERQPVLVEEFLDTLQVVGGRLHLLGIGAQRLHLAADENIAGRHVLADLLAGITQDDDAPAIHHVAGHEIGVAGAAQRTRLHHLARARSHIALHHDLGAADRDTGDGAGIAADDDRALVHIVRQAPAGIAVDLEIRAVGQAGAEIARRAAHPDLDVLGQPDADMVPRVGVQDFDILTPFAALADQLVGFGY